MRIDQLPTPALILDLDVVEANVERMAAKCRDLGVRLRPHAKTHKCVEVAALQRAAGATGLTVSTLAEAEIFAAAGEDDLTWAFPLIPSRIRQAAALMRKGVRLRLVVDSVVAVEQLVQADPDTGGRPFEVLMKVDCGYHRAGVDPCTTRPLEIARMISASSNLRFAGILSHSGQAYDRRGAAQLAAVAEHERSVMVEMAERLGADGTPVETISIGSTPSMSAVKDLTGVTEARPGNYVFFDADQLAIGSCTIEECGLTMVATVVSSSRTHSVIDAGALALSKDTVDGGYGEIFRDLESRDLALQVVSVSQEHGILPAPMAVGTVVRILPAHSCLAVACFDEFFVVRGRRVVDRWAIDRRRS